MGKRRKVRVNRGRVGLQLLAVVLLLLALGGSVSWAREGATPPQTTTNAPLLQSGSGRHYYLTTSTHRGDTALTACASGYHMASLWEIMDLSNLAYETTIGYNYDDSGAGPPTSLYGWVRTGAISGASNTPGQGNCSVWTNGSGAQYGTRINLPWDWTASTNIGSWQVGASVCNTSLRVWCVEDYSPDWNVGSYYLTPDDYTGATALTACASGYHMASLWEIMDVSNLVYDTAIGSTYADSGSGPPVPMFGWVRTGGISSEEATPGRGNCSAWSSTSGSGTRANLPWDWTASTDIEPWQVGTGSCGGLLPVWCVRPSIRVYLPLVLRNL